MKVSVEGGLGVGGREGGREKGVEKGVRKSEWEDGGGRGERRE